MVRGLVLVLVLLIRVLELDEDLLQLVVDLEEPQQLEKVFQLCRQKCLEEESEQVDETVEEEDSEINRSATATIAAVLSTHFVRTHPTYYA